MEKWTSRSMMPFFTGAVSPARASALPRLKDRRERTGSMISPMGLMILMPSMIIKKPAARSKNRACRMKTPMSDRNNPTTKKTAAMPRVKATPIMKPSFEAEADFFRYSSFLRAVMT